nr:L120 [uncultured bacterium]
MQKPLVFVYGSLRRGQRAHPRLRPAAVCLGRASVSGRLHDCGCYPAALPSRRPGERVHGELYRLTRPDVLAALDRYEDCDPQAPHGGEYRREPAAVRLAGRRLSAWVYWHNGPLRGARRIRTGIWRGPGR